MPLPADATAVWPPPETDRAYADYRKWAAWYSGDLDALAKVYEQGVGYADPVISADQRTALVAARPRSFHGAPPARGALRSAKLHIPLASDIATTSSDLLFGEPPQLVAAGEDARRRDPRASGEQSPTQRRLDFYLANGLQAALLESGEIASAFGGVFLRVGWDTDVSDAPLFDAVPPDAAVPDFRSGQLTGVTLHRRLRDLGDGKTWRHLERHEPGRILHGLYCSGDDRTLGKKMQLPDHPDTEAFAKIGDKAGQVITGAKGLTCEYVPNMRPNRRLRGQQLGRSDLDGIESIMDALDEAWSSWMRDLRQGKGRILVPEVYLDGQGRGRGAVFDTEQEVFQLVNALPGGQGGGLSMEHVQFEIRVQQHQQTCEALTEQAVRGAGYSAQSFGMQGDGGMATATEVQSRNTRSFITRGKKLLYYRPALARLARVALEIDAQQFKPDGVVAELPDVQWPDGVATDPQALAQTLQLLKGAEAASIRTRVQLWNPDWDAKRVDEEVKAIQQEGEPAPSDAPPPGSTLPAGDEDDDAADAAAGKPTGAPATGVRPAVRPSADRPRPAAGVIRRPGATTPAPVKAARR